MEKNIVIVVDMQKGFARYEQTQKLTERIVGLLDLEVFDSVVATKFLNDTDSSYEKCMGWHRLKTEEERAINPDIDKHVDYICEKYIYNCVNANFIQRLCQLNGGMYPERVFVIGADTDCCVMTIATALFENNIRPVVLSHYCDSNGGPESHQAGLLCLKRLIGEKQIINAKINSREDLIGL